MAPPSLTRWRALAATIALAFAFAACLATTVAGAAPADPARRAVNPYTAKEVCGPGYWVIDRHRLRDDGVRLGRVVLLYNGSSNCVATIKTYHPGQLDYIGASLQRKGGPIRSDDDVYRYYAGPVRVSARGVCVKWSGYITPSESLGDGFISRYGHCLP